MECRSNTQGAWLCVLLAGSAGCGHTAGGGGRADAGALSGSDGALLDASDAPDAAPGELPRFDAGAAADAATEPTADAGSADAGEGIGALRARLCTAPSYPAPLARDDASAAPLGSARYDFVEGPVWVEAQQKLFFSDMRFSDTGALGPSSQIHALALDGSSSVFVSSSGSNGLALGPAGSLLAATHDTQSLSLYAFSDWQRTRLDVRAGGKHLNSPNDLVLRSDGNVYFTDPDYQLGVGRTSETGVTAAYRVRSLGAGTLAAEPFETTLRQPNGIALSPDEATLYLGSSGAELYAYALADDGSVGARRVFARPGGSDGLTVDCAGNVYVTTGQSVRIYGPDGEDRGSIAVAETPSNVAFGGPDQRTLFITAQTRVYSIDLAVPGFPY